MRLVCAFSLCQVLAKNFLLKLNSRSPRYCTIREGKDGENSYDGELVLEDSHAEPKSFLAFHPRNYLGFFASCADCADAPGNLSEADCFVQWRVDELFATVPGRKCAASVGIRAFRCHNNDRYVRG